MHNLNVFFMYFYYSLENSYINKRILVTMIRYVCISFSKFHSSIFRHWKSQICPKRSWVYFRIKFILLISRIVFTRYNFEVNLGNFVFTAHNDWDIERHLYIYILPFSTHHKMLKYQRKIIIYVKAKTTWLFMNLPTQTSNLIHNSPRTPLFGKFVPFPISL